MQDVSKITIHFYDNTVFFISFTTASRSVLLRKKISYRLPVINPMKKASTISWKIRKTATQKGPLSGYL